MSPGESRDPDTARFEKAQSVRVDPTEGERLMGRPYVEPARRRDVIPRAEISVDESLDTGAYAASRRASRPGSRRVKRTVRSVNPASMLKLSLFYYGCFLVIWLLVAAIFYWVMAAVGLWGPLATLSNAVFKFEEKPVITLWVVEKWALLVGLIFVVIGSLINVMLALLYNAGADLVGGLEVTFVDRDL